MKKPFNIIALVSLLFPWLIQGCNAAEINQKDFDRYSKNDIESLVISRQAMDDIISYMKNTPELYNTSGSKEKMSLNREQRLKVWNTWQSFLDHILLMDSLGNTYSDIYKKSKKDMKKKSFRISFAAFLAQYRCVMDFITITEQNPDFHVVLNEAVPELGLPKNTYSRFKYRFLNVIRGAEFARLNVVYGFYRKDRALSITKGMEEDIKIIWKAGKGKGPLQTAQNGMKILQDSAFTAWFPVQKGVSNLMSKVRVRRGAEFLITHEQIKSIIPELEPGDIMLQRREWCLTNIGLPGFWTHAALYIGSPDERKKYFNDPETINRIKAQDEKYGDIEELLMKTYPDTYKKSLPLDDRNIPRVIEAKGEGVIFTTLEFSAYADSMVVLRPLVSKMDKATAIIRAFNFHGRPYDFNFDFLTDSTLVCSELIYKAYLPEGSDKGLHLPLTELMGRKILSPNNIAKLFDEEYEKEPQMKMALFLDGNEKENASFRSDVNTFKKSWKRPKWHIVIKETIMDPENKR